MKLGQREWKLESVAEARQVGNSAHCDPEISLSRTELSNNQSVFLLSPKFAEISISSKDEQRDRERSRRFSLLRSQNRFHVAGELLFRFEHSLTAALIVGEASAS